MKDNVCVLMLNWNTPEMSYESIQSVRRSTYHNYKVCLFDNGSSETNYKKLSSLVKDSADVYRINNNMGYAGGMNFALTTIAQQIPGYFLIMNNDTILDSNAMSALVTAAKKNNNNCVVTGKVYHYNNQSRIQTVGNTFNFKTLESHRIGYNEIDNGQFDIECEREMIDDIFMLLPYFIYKKVGGYNPYFYLNYEQTDLIIRIKQAGYKVIYTPNAKLYHKGSFSSGGLGNPHMMYWDGKSIIILHYLHQKRMRFVFFIMGTIFRSFKSLLKGFVAEKIVHKKGVMLKSRYARLLGIIHGVLWTFKPEKEKGTNPFQV